MVDDICSISLCGNDSICVNTFIETQINMKRLKFHTPDDKGKSKCHQLHIGGNKEYCPQLKVHGTNMEKVISDKYLGDILSYDGTNFLNINNRHSETSPSSECVTPGVICSAPIYECHFYQFTSD